VKKNSSGARERHLNLLWLTGGGQNERSYSPSSRDAEPVSFFISS